MRCMQVTLYSEDGAVVHDFSPVSNSACMAAAVNDAGDCFTFGGFQQLRIICASDTGWKEAGTTEVSETKLRAAAGHKTPAQKLARLRILAG